MTTPTRDLLVDMTQLVIDPVDAPKTSDLVTFYRWIQSKIHEYWK